MVAGHLFEDADELLPDHAPLPLRVPDAGQLREEAVLRLHVHERHAEVQPERLLHLLRLPLAVQAVVDEDARELIPHGAIHEEGRDGGVDAA
jgi:hypothetical protein